MSADGSARRTAVAAVAALGLWVSSGMLAVVVAGLLQWKSVPGWSDTVVALVVVGGGLFLGGQVAEDVAPRRGLVGVGLAAAVVGLLGWMLACSAEAHGDGLEMRSVAAAVVVVAVVGGAGAWWRARTAGRRPGAGDRG